MKNEIFPYEDIIDRYPGAIPGHPSMPLYDRAAQFAPFAALTGFGAVITETGRYTEEWKQPDENVLEKLDAAFAGILQEDPEAQIELVWFREDDRKIGGAYRTTVGRLKKADRFRRVLVLLDEDDTDLQIPFERIVSVRRTDANDEQEV